MKRLFNKTYKLKIKEKTKAHKVICIFKMP